MNLQAIKQTAYEVVDVSHGLYKQTYFGFDFGRRAELDACLNIRQAINHELNSQISKGAKNE